MHPKRQKAFNISISIFIATLIFAIVAIITNTLVPDEVFYHPSYEAHTGVKELIGIIKILDTADFYATVLSGIASGFTYFIKSLP